MTSVIATTRSPLQASISSVGVQFMAFICKENGASLGASYEDNDSKSSISSLMVPKWNSRSRGDEFAAYVVPDDATADIVSAI
jgi:hypothetical protein